VTRLSDANRLKALAKNRRWACALKIDPDFAAEGVVASVMVFSVKSCQALPPTCGDNLKNQDESDVNCGGSRCGLCPEFKTCNSATDCSTTYCILDDTGCGIWAGLKICKPTTCFNGTSADVGEEGVDCGYDACRKRCNVGEFCVQNCDCGVPAHTCTSNMCSSDQTRRT